MRLRLRALLLLAGSLSGVHAQDPASPQPLRAVYETPTVTREMGDVGGKFFGTPPDPAKTRHFYVAAEPELWDFAPQGADAVCGKPLPSSLLLFRSSWKIRYVQYADAAFTARVLQPDRLGILGPVLRGTTGEYLAVTFLNRSWRPLSMHPHGVRYDKDSEGSFEKGTAGRGAAIAPGASFTYVWKLDETSGPRPGEPSSKAWLYHSHVEGDDEINLGLAGFIVVTDPLRARPDGTPNDVDREMGALFKIFDESAANGAGTPDLDDQPEAASMLSTESHSWSTERQLTEETQRHAINGRVFGNLTGLNMNAGERVRWYLFGLGSEQDFHTAHWHGARLVENGRHRSDVVELLPATANVADMVADRPGTWLMHCQVGEHMNRGMFAPFTVFPPGASGTDRESDIPFFGLPESLATLRIPSAELVLNKQDMRGSEIDLTGQVTVPNPMPLLGSAFSIQIGGKRAAFQGDRSGVCSGPEGVLIVTNATSYGVVLGSVLRFEATLKGPEWIEELTKLGALKDGVLTENATMPLAMQVGPALHTASAQLKLASE